MVHAAIAYKLRMLESPGVQWAFTARPVDRVGAPNVTATAPSPDARFNGLMPNTTVSNACILVPSSARPCCAALRLCRGRTDSGLRLPQVCLLLHDPLAPLRLQYEVTVVGTLGDGTESAAPNVLTFRTPDTG